MTKILTLLTDGIGAQGGIAQFNRDLLGAFAQSSQVTSVLVLPRAGAGEPGLLGKIRYRAPVPGRLAWSGYAFAMAARERFDVIFCGHLYAAPLAAVLARICNARLWLQAHGIDAWQAPGKLIEAAVSRADLVTAVSRYTRRCLLGWSDLAPQRVRVLPNTVSNDYVVRPRRADLVQRYGLAGRKVILTVGRLSSSERYKGHDRVIAALPGIVARCPSAVYLIVGTGDDAPRLEAEATRLGVRERVVFAGQVPRDELPDHFALADVFAMPSTGEGFGIVFLEAARSGLPVVAGNRDGSVDALADGAIGRLIDPRDPVELADAILTALEGRQPTGPEAVARFNLANFEAHVDALVGQFHG